MNNISEENFELDSVGSSTPYARGYERKNSAGFLPETLEAAFAETDDVAADPRMSDPVFRKLAMPELAPIPKRNRARLQMQNPYRLYFYWSVKANPFKTLNSAFAGLTGSYVLIVKLVETASGNEEIFPINSEGNWWFDVKPDSEYRAEIGFYAPNRPYIRILYSNTVQTPRVKPSMRSDYTPSFSINARQFAEVLDSSGYKRDAVDVVLAGDDSEAADRATANAVKSLSDSTHHYSHAQANQIRFALFALASGYTLNDLREVFSRDTFELLEKIFAGISKENALAALKLNFDVVEDEIFVEETLGPEIFGASLVHFPKTMRSVKTPGNLLPKLSKFGNPENLSSQFFK